MFKLNKIITTAKSHLAAFYKTKLINIMKQFVFIFLLLSIPIIVNAQSSLEKFEYSEIGINDFIIANVVGKTQQELFSKTLNWVNVTWKNPEVVLKMKIENEKLRVEGIAENLIKVRNSSFNATYVIEITFKEGKYKFELVSLMAEKADYKKIPSFKTEQKMVKNFGTTSTDIENYFNKLNQNLREYIIGKSEEKW
jgi:hypothetical protein